MDGDLVDHRRVRQLNDQTEPGGGAVIYLMSRDQRVHDNHALVAAQHHALQRDLPLMVLFVLYPSAPNRSRQHYRFMLDGLREVADRLHDLNITFVLSTERPHEAVQRFDPATLFVDFSPLRGPRAIRRAIAQRALHPVFEVDAHNIVPAWLASDKEEWAAHTLRRKLHRLVPGFLNEPEQAVEHPHHLEHDCDIDWDEILEQIDAPDPPDYHLPFEPGEAAAARVLADFVEHRLEGYAEQRNDPTIDGLSNLSPYLHFGQIASLRAALEVSRAASGGSERLRDSCEAFLEEIIVRKELADNFCYYNPHYDSWDGLRDWAKQTLSEHRGDTREYLYTLDEFEAAATHDPAWNAAQNQMLRTGKMHGYMRMYWAKKILEWSPDPETAIDIAITLNDRYELDGYDPNGYAGVLWSIGGVHDRPWAEREIFGKVRYMNANGLKRKFDIDAYVERWGDGSE